MVLLSLVSFIANTRTKPPKMKLVAEVILLGIAACCLADVSHLDGLSRMYLPPQANQQSQYGHGSLKQQGLSVQQQGADMPGLVKPGQQYQSTPAPFNSQFGGSRQQLGISQSSFGITASVNQLKSDGLQPGLDSLSSTSQDCQQNPLCSPSGNDNSPQGQPLSIPRRPNQPKTDFYQQTSSNTRFQQNSNSPLQPGLDSLNPTSQLDCGQNPSCSPNQNGPTAQDQFLPNSRLPQDIQPRLSLGSTTPQYATFDSQQTSNCCNQQGPLNKQGRKPLQGLQGLIRNQQSDVKIQEYLPPNASKDTPPSHTLEEDGYHYKTPENNRLRY